MGLFKILQGKGKAKKPRTESVDRNGSAKPEKRQHSSSGNSRSTGSKMKKKTKKSQKENQNSQARAPKDVFPKKSISSLARSLKGDDWQKLASALGFMEMAISHFTGRASSSQNTYSQACLMLRTWRDQMPLEEILPRLTDALKRIRRHDLALKMGLELGVIAANDFDEHETEGVRTDAKSILKTLESDDRSEPPYYESKLIIGDEKISFLARQLLAPEEWKRLAYALGFLPHEVSQIIASASSSQNLYSQAHVMLKRWRLRTHPNQIIPRLKAGFVRIRRHDLVDLLKIGAIAGTEDILHLIEEQLRESRKPQDSFGASLTKNFSAFQQ